MGMGPPRFGRPLAGAAVLFVGLSLAFAAPARAETTLPGVAGAVDSAPVAAVADAAVVIVTAGAAPTVAPVVARAPARVPAPQATVPQATVPQATVPGIPDLPAARPVLQPSPVALPALVRPPHAAAVLSASRVVAAGTPTHRAQPAARSTRLAPRAPSRRPGRPAISQAAAGSSTAATAHVSPNPAAMPSKSAPSTARPSSGAAPVPTHRRSADSSAGTALGTSSSGGSTHLVAAPVRSFALARQETRLRLPLSTSRPRSTHSSLELERPG
jgi:hypothetical protein